jgi:hypothetical protein
MRKKMHDEMIKQAYEYGCQQALAYLYKLAAKFDESADPIKPGTMGWMYPLLGPIGSAIAGYKSPDNMDKSPGWRSLGGGILGGMGGSAVGGVLNAAVGGRLGSLPSMLAGMAGSGYGAARGYTSAFSPAEQKHYFGKEYNFPL